MKKQSLFYGIIITGMAFLLFIENWHIATLQPWTTWPSLLILAGGAFLFESISGRIPLSFLPGVLLLLFGFHFHLLRFFEFWPDGTGIYFLYFGTAILLDFLKTRNAGWFTGILFLLLGGIFFYSKELRDLAGEQASFFIERFGPLILIVFGLYLTFRRR